MHRPLKRDGKCVIFVDMSEGESGSSQPPLTRPEETEESTYQPYSAEGDASLQGTVPPGENVDPDNPDSTTDLNTTPAENKRPELSDKKKEEAAKEWEKENADFTTADALKDGIVDRLLEEKRKEFEEAGAQLDADGKKQWQEYYRGLSFKDLNETFITLAASQAPETESETATGTTSTQPEATKVTLTPEQQQQLEKAQRAKDRQKEIQFMDKWFGTNEEPGELGKIWDEIQKSPEKYGLNPEDFKKDTADATLNKIIDKEAENAYREKFKIPADQAFTPEQEEEFKKFLEKYKTEKGEEFEKKKRNLVAALGETISERILTGSDFSTFLRTLLAADAYSSRSGEAFNREGHNPNLKRVNMDEFLENFLDIKNGESNFDLNKKKLQEFCYLTGKQLNIRGYEDWRKNMKESEIQDILHLLYEKFLLIGAEETDATLVKAFSDSDKHEFKNKEFTKEHTVTKDFIDKLQMMHQDRDYFNQLLGKKYSAGANSSNVTQGNFTPSSTQTQAAA
jgi:hypothetical protein